MKVSRLFLFHTLFLSDCLHPLLGIFLDREELSTFHPLFRHKLQNNITFEEDSADDVVYLDENGRVCSKAFAKTSASSFDGILVTWTCPHGFILGSELMRARESVSRIARTICTRFAGRCEYCAIFFSPCSLLCLPYSIPLLPIPFTHF